MSLSDRLKRLEANAKTSDRREAVLFLPESNAEPSAQVRADWEEYLRTGTSKSGVVIYPKDVEISHTPDGRRVIIEEREDLYGNDAHEMQRKREAIEAHPDERADHS